MIKQVVQVMAGQLLWMNLKRQEHLDYKKMVLVLTGENEKVDLYALRYLDKAMNRKSADKALILSDKQKCIDMALRCNYQHTVKTKLLSQKKIMLLFKWFSLDKFYKNLIFTYVRTPKDNLLDRFVRETDINEEEIVCLCLYNFREMPTENTVSKDV